jgi:hypothetical protein
VVVRGALAQDFDDAVALERAELLLAGDAVVSEPDVAVFEAHAGCALGRGLAVAAVAWLVRGPPEPADAPDGVFGSGAMFVVRLPN